MMMKVTCQKYGEQKKKEEEGGGGGAFTHL
jgi:hypothetical protein